jgi:hypothetical protein
VYDLNNENNIKLTATFVNNECPPATQDISINLANREKAIKDGGYGPLNPAEPNEEFWQEKATRWSITPDEAKKSICGNCVMFIRTTKMRDCIAQGIEQGGSSEDNAWDAVDAAELGYCEAFDFKCAASRTCNAWVAGGPIDDSSTTSITSAAYEGGDGDITIVDDIFVEEPFEGDINDLIASYMKDIMEVAEEDPNADSYEESEMEDL